MQIFWNSSIGKEDPGELHYTFYPWWPQTCPCSQLLLSLELRHSSLDPLASATHHVIFRKLLCSYTQAQTMSFLSDAWTCHWEGWHHLPNVFTSKISKWQERGQGEGQLDVVDCVRQAACRRSQPSGQLSVVNRNLAASLPAGPPAASSTAPGDGAALERIVVKVIKPEIISSASSQGGSTCRVIRVGLP